MDDSNQNTFPPSPYSSQIPNLQVPSISSQPVQRASARPNRSRGLLHNKKRLKTLGPPRRVLISNSDSDNSSSKCMELEDSFVEKLSPVFETNDREIEVVSLEPDVNSDTEQQGMASSFNLGRERVEEASVSREISEHRKRKAGEANQDNSISLVLSMNSPASHYESDEDHIFSQHGHEQFDIAEFRSGRHVIDVMSKTPCLQKLNVQENLSGNSSRNPKFSTDCNVVKQNLFEKPSFKMSLSNPVAAESSRRVHFSVLESSSRADDMELSGKFGMDKQINKTHGSCVNVKSHSEYTDPFRSEADQHDDQKMSSDLHLTGGSLQKAYEMVAIDTGVEKLQTHLNSLSLTENQGHKVLGNSEQLFTSLEECAKLSQPSTQQRDYDNAAMDFQDKRSNSMATTGAGKGKALNTFNSECFSCISSASVTSSSTSSQGEPISLALSSVTSQKGVLDSNRNLNLTSPPHGSLDNKRTGFCESMIASESQHVPRSTFVTHSLAGQSTVATATTSLTRQDLSTEQQSSFKDNDERRLQMQVNTAKCKNPKASVKLEENDNLKSHVTYKSIEEKDCKPEIAQGLETSRQPSVSQLSMDKKDNRETSTSLKKHIDPDTFFKVNRRLYQKLGKIGSGGSSEVYKVIASDCTIYALKKIKLKGRDYSTAYGFCQEIDYLTKLRGKNYIIQLVDYEITSKTILRDLRIAESKAKDGKINEDAYIYMVLEYGEVDLAQMLSQKWKESDVAGTQIDENWLRYYWQQILMAVNTIHEQRIVHSDLKPANFLLVKGVLKLIDFGIAKAIQSDTTNIQRESQVGTLNYMSPEAFMCNDTDENGNIIKCGRPSDIWSLGCILYQMVYGKTPFAAFTSFWSKFKEITNKNHKISFPPVSNPWLLDIMKKCLAWDRNDRLRIPQLLSHPFLKPPITTACPSMEEKYCRYLSEISEVYNANAEIQEMCEKLKSSLREKQERALELE